MTTNKEAIKANDQSERKRFKRIYIGGENENVGLEMGTIIRAVLRCQPEFDHAPSSYHNFE